MTWDTVGQWIKDNAAPGAALVGSLLTGNVPGAVAAGVALVSSATGTTDPAAALQALQADQSALVRLRELANDEQASIRQHIRDMHALELRDAQSEHQTTQQTIRTGDNTEDPLVRRTRPLQSWLSLIAALMYVFWVGAPSTEVLMALLALPWTYAGLRQIGKGVDAVAAAKAASGESKKK